MGLTSSTAKQPEIGADNISTPPWAAERSKWVNVFFDVEADR